MLNKIQSLTIFDSCSDESYYLELIEILSEYQVDCKKLLSKSYALLGKFYESNKNYQKAVGSYLNSLRHDPCLLESAEKIGDICMNVFEDFQFAFVFFQLTRSYMKANYCLKKQIKIKNFLRNNFLNV